MSAKFWTYCVASGISSLGTWIRIIAVNWLVIDKLQGDTTMNVARAAICTALALVVSSTPVRHFNVTKALFMLNVLEAFVSLMLALMVFSDTLSYGKILALELLAAGFGAYAGPSRSIFFRDLAGNFQFEGAVAENRMLWGARIFAGIFAFPLAPFGAGLLVGVDVLSFVPVIFFLLSELETEKGGAIEMHMPSLDWKMGVRALYSEPRHLCMLFFLLMTNFMGGLSFWSSSEIIRREHGGSLLHVCAWISLTGLAAFCGNDLIGGVVRRFPRMKEVSYFSCLFAAQLALISVGLSAGFDRYLGCYLIFAFVSAGAGTMGEAYFRNFPKATIGSVERIKDMLLRGLMWLQVACCYLAGSAGLTRGQALALCAGAAFSLSLSLLCVGNAHCSNMFRAWFPLKPSDTPEADLNT